MNRISKWIQKRKSYSNPLFGTMVILGGMAFPVFNAAAALEQPVQPMAQTAEQIVDALDAVEAGATIDQAFGIQPVPIRDWNKVQKTIYEGLFGVPYDINDAFYTFDNELSEADEYTTVSGALALGLAFSLRVSMIAEYDYLNDNNMSDQDANDLASSNASILVLAGTIRTPLGSFDILGSAWQIDRPDGGRDRGLLIFDYADSSMIDDFEYLNQPSHVMEVDSQPQDCEGAFQIAENNFRADIEIAKNNLENCMLSAMLEFAVEMGVCMGLAMKVTAAAAATGGLLGVAAALEVTICALTVLARAAQNAFNCTSDYLTAQANARVRKATARANAIAHFGGGNCPGDWGP